MAKANYTAHTAPIFTELNILPVDKLITQAKLTGTFMHSVFYEYAPSSFLDVWKKNREKNLTQQLWNQDDFYLPPVKTEAFKRIPIYSFAKEWNELGDLKFQRNQTTFLIELKSKLWENTTSSLSLI